MKKSHKFFSKLAFNLAENQLGKTKFNPSVGCVVVKDNSVISSGSTSINGRPHAEFNALKKNLNFKGSNLYVTLEPCTHYGLTPACINIIKKKRINNVYYNFDDVDERTYRKAKKKLKTKITKLRKTDEKNKFFYESYFLNKKKNFPFIDAKIAISKDFYTINKKSKWITNFRSRKVAQLIRSRYDCIVSTSTSINKDNSLLNCRIDGFNNFKPDLVIIDRNLKIKNKCRIFDISKKRKTYLITTSNNKQKIKYLKKKKINVIKIDKLDSKKDFNLLFCKIFKVGKRRILIETGLIFLNELLRYKLIDNLYVFQTKNKLKKNGYNNVAKNYVKKIKFTNKIKVNLNHDTLYKIRTK